MRANLLGSLMEGKVTLSPEYSPIEILRDLHLKVGMKVSYMQCWRVRKLVRMLEMGNLRTSTKFFLGFAQPLLGKILIQEHFVT